MGAAQTLQAAAAMQPVSVQAVLQPGPPALQPGPLQPAATLPTAAAVLQPPLQATAALQPTSALQPGTLPPTSALQQAVLQPQALQPPTILQSGTALPPALGAAMPGTLDPALQSTGALSAVPGTEATLAPAVTTSSGDPFQHVKDKFAQQTNEVLAPS